MRISYTGMRPYALMDKPGDYLPPNLVQKKFQEIFVSYLVSNFHDRKYVFGKDCHQFKTILTNDIYDRHTAL